MDQKQQRKTSSLYGLAYTQALPTLQQIAKEHGYALAVHGSMHTDLDLIACPWTEDATEPELMVEAMRKVLDGIFTHTPKDYEKPHGRQAWTIIPAIHTNHNNGLEWQPWIDLSVMPRQPRPFTATALTDSQ